MDKDGNLENLARLLVARLERLSVDSYWAHRASGLRGTLLRDIEAIENGLEMDNGVLAGHIKRGFEILETAAKEITPPASSIC